MSAIGEVISVGEVPNFSCSLTSRLLLSRVGVLSGTIFFDVTSLVKSLFIGSSFIFENFDFTNSFGKRKDFTATLSFTAISELI